MGILERVAAGGEEPGVPHERGIEGGIADHGTPPLVAGPGAALSYQIVVLDTDGYGLRVTESVGWRMAASAGVVAVEPPNNVEPQQSAEIG